MKRVNCENSFSDGALLNSLSAIKQAHNRIHFLTSMRASPSNLASQIELCDVLLAEISVVRTTLVKDLRQMRGLDAPSLYGRSLEAASVNDVLRGGGSVAA
jgi:hypothetical protein